MSLFCNWTETTTGAPCGNRVSPGSTHCAAGHPLPAAIDFTHGVHAPTVAEQGTLDVEEVLAPASATKDPSRMYDDEGNVIYDEFGDPVECSDKRKGGCNGDVEFRLNPFTDSFKSYTRCQVHAEAWLDGLERINSRYPDSPVAPSWFDSANAGERWDDDY